MTKRTLEICTILALFISSTLLCNASDLRLTPTVRAIKRARFSVVNIHSEKNAKRSSPLFSSAPGRKVNGMGTGIIVDERGYIVTNHHVVDAVNSLRVTMNDGSSYDARVVSFDLSHDLALIKVDATKPLRVMPLGTSSDLMLGETVIAVGNAFGYEDTVTGGMVSALSRDVEVNDKQAYQNLIQTDASINPGNSGGPLINMDGEVIGINVVIRAGAQRIGFAIPIDDARKTIAELFSIEHLCKTFHGLETTDIKRGAERFLRVDAVAPDSPAKAAGIEVGDILQKAGTTKVVDRADLERALLGRSAGDQVEILIRRNQKNEMASLKLAANPKSSIAAIEQPVVRTGKADDVDDRVWKMFGLKLQSLSQSQLGLVKPRYRGGMRVISVRPQSPAALNGIRNGDILVGLHVWETINDENITYVIEHPQLQVFNPLKFYVLRGAETLYGHLQLAFLKK